MSQFNNLLQRFSSGFDLFPKDVTFVFNPSMERRRRKRKQPMPELKANKFLLALASPVFEAMFNGPLKEQSNRIYVTDIDERAFQVLLNFIHLKDIKFDSVEECLAIYKVADKYDLPDLCEMVNNFIISRVTATNVCQIYEHSSLYNILTLKEVCQRIFIQETERVLTSPGFFEASVSTVNDIFCTSGLEIESEMVLCDNLSKYVSINKLTINDVHRYLRASVTSIRFLTLPPDAIDGLAKILSKHEQKLLKNSRLPKHFNTTRKQRYIREAPEFTPATTLSDKNFYSYYF